MGQQLSTVNDNSDNQYISPPGMIRHLNGKSYIHPYGGSSNPSNYTKLIAHAGFHENVQFRFVQVVGHWGYIEHVSSGKFLHPKGGSKNPENGTPVILHSGNHGGCLFTYDDDYNVIQHRGGLYLHPEGGSNDPSDNVTLLLHHGVHDGVKWFPVSVVELPAEVYPVPEVSGQWFPVKRTKTDDENESSKLKISIGRKKTMCTTFRHSWMISSVALNRISSFIENDNKEYAEVMQKTDQSAFEDPREFDAEAGSDIVIWQWVWSISQWGDGWDFKTNIITHSDREDNCPSLTSPPILLSLV